MKSVGAELDKKDYVQKDIFAMHETFLYLCSLYRVLHKLSLNVVSFNVRRLVVKSKEVSAGELCICVSFLPLALS